MRGIEDTAGGGRLNDEDSVNLLNLLTGKTAQDLTEIRDDISTQISAAQAVVEGLQNAPNEKIIEALKQILSVGRATAIMTLPKLGKLLTAAEPVHRNFPLVMACLNADVPIWLHGEAGSGKSTAGFYAAERLSLPFRAISLGPTTSKSDLLGYRDAGGNYRDTGFREIYENGGVFLFDEIDNAHPSILTLMNSSIANGHGEFPDGRISRHETARFIASANTIGRGATAEYVGRAPIDAATIDRFAFIEMNTDPDLEESIVLGEAADPQEKLNLSAGEVPDAKEWLAMTRANRDAADELGIRAIISQRAAIYGAKLAQTGVGTEHLLNMLIYKGMREEDRERMAHLAEQKFRAHLAHLSEIKLEKVNGEFKAPRFYRDFDKIGSYDSFVGFYAKLLAPNYRYKYGFENAEGEGSTLGFSDARNYMTAVCWNLEKKHGLSISDDVDDRYVNIFSGSVGFEDIEALLKNISERARALSDRFKDGNWYSITNPSGQLGVFDVKFQALTDTTSKINNFLTNYYKESEIKDLIREFQIAQGFTPGALSLAYWLVETDRDTYIENQEQLDAKRATIILPQTNQSEDEKPAIDPWAAAQSDEPAF